MGRLASKKDAIGLVFLSLSTFVVCLSATCTNVIAFDLKLDLDSLLGNDFQWTFPAFVLGECAAMGLCAGLLDRYGRRKPFILGSVVFMIGSILCAVATDMVSFNWFRVIQGTGAGIIIVTAIAQVYFALEAPRRRYLGNGIMSIGFGLGMIFGIFIGRAAIDMGFGWRNLMWAFLIAQVLLMYPCLRVLPEGGNSEMKPDILGSAILAVAVGYFVYFLEKLYLDWELDDLGTIAGLVFLIVMTVSFCIVEYKCPYSMLRRKVNDRNLTVVSMVMIVLLGTIDMGCVGWMAKVALFTYGMTVLQVLPPFIVLIMGAVVTGYTASKTIHLTGHAFWYIVAAILSPIALLSVTLINHNDPWAFFYIHAFLLGLAIGCLVSLINATVQNRLDKDNNGAYMSIAIMARTSALWLGYNVYQAFVDAHMAKDLSPTIDYWSSVLGIHLPCNSMLPCLLVTPLEDILKIIPGLTAQIGDTFAQGISIGCVWLGIIFTLVAVPLSIVFIGKKKVI